jgi:hypothetical protein
MRLNVKYLSFLLVFICSCASKSTSNEEKYTKEYQKEYTKYVKDILEKKKYSIDFINDQHSYITNPKFMSYETYYANQFVSDVKDIKHQHTIKLDNDLVTIINGIDSVGNVITKNIYLVRDPDYDIKLSYKIFKKKVQFGIDEYPIKLDDVIQIFLAKKKINRSEFGFYSNIFKSDPKYRLLDDGIDFLKKSEVWSVRYRTTIEALSRDGNDDWIMIIDAKTGDVIEDKRCHYIVE